MLLYNKMRQLTLFALLAYACLLTGCSYLTDFVVVNESDQSVQVHFRIKDYPGPFAPPIAPATIAISGLSTKGNDVWDELPGGADRVDQENRTITVELISQNALRIARLHNYAREDSSDAARFPVEEILVTGQSGDMKLTGEQLRLACVEKSKALYSLTCK
jgi:hypothetical protein